MSKLYSVLAARRDAIMRGEKKDEGFTLIELLIVVLIIGVLAAIAIPVFLSTVENSKKTAGQQTVSQLATSITAWSSANGGKLPSSTNFAATSSGPDGDLGKALPSDGNIQVSYGVDNGHFCAVAAYIGTVDSVWATYDGQSPVKVAASSATAPAAAVEGTVAECNGVDVTQLTED